MVRVRRGVYILPSLLTLGNLFCGYASILYAMRGNLEIAAPLIGIAIVLDMLDGRIARLTGTTSAFGLEFDSLADIISFGIAPAILMFQWGLQPLNRLGWAVGFIYVTAAAMRLARFNIQSASALDKRFFVGLPSPAAAAIPASTAYFYPPGFADRPGAFIAAVVMVVPALLMVSTIRFRSFKADMRVSRSYKVLALLAIVIAVVQWHPPTVLLVLAYAYLTWGVSSWAWTRLRRRSPEPRSAPETPAAE
ncbi:MAG: CDP-diacylglycerol--serine O-phosphatidyltransferase [Acidobacteriota bacterium]